MRDLSATLYQGQMFDENAAAIIPYSKKVRAAIWCDIHTDDFKILVREINSA